MDALDNSMLQTVRGRAWLLSHFFFFVNLNKLVLHILHSEPIRVTYHQKVGVSSIGKLMNCSIFLQGEELR